MMPRTLRARFLPLLLACAAAVSVRAQQLIGYVNTRDAETTGASDMMDGQAVLTGSVGVTAKDHTAPITLGRGGSVRVCQTSVLHLTEGRAATIPAPLLFSLDRGAIEIQTDSTPNDTIITPDLRFTVHNSAPLDLRLRIARNGDTCVDNRGTGAPTLAVSDAFGESMYEVAPKQHLLFEHGSLHEVVDNESSPCGCPDEKGMSVADALLAPPSTTSGPKSPNHPPPAPTPPAAVVVAAPVIVPTAPPVATSVAAPTPAKQPAPVATAPVAAPTIAAVAPVTQAATSAPVAAPTPVPAPPAAEVPTPAAVVASAPSAPAPPTPAEQAAAEQAAEQAVEQAAAQAAARAAALHPFPAAISEGLVPPAEAPPVADGQGSAQLATGLAYNAPVPAPVSAPAGADAAAAAVLPVQPTPAQPGAAKPAPHGVGHAIGRFFRKLFGGN
jgi:hypothetical protein